MRRKCEPCAHPKVALTVDSDTLPPHVLLVRGLYEQMARITITPDRAKLLDFETRFPVAVEQLLAQMNLRAGSQAT